MEMIQYIKIIRNTILSHVIEEQTRVGCSELLEHVETVAQGGEVTVV